MMLAGARNTAAETASTPGSTPRVAPLHAGDPLTLREAIALALRFHPARLAALSEAAAVHERIGEAESGYLPQVFGTAQYLRSTDNGIGGTAYLTAPGFPRYPSTGETSGSTRSFDNYLMGVSAYQYLFDFGRLRGLVDERKAEADLEQARARLVELDVVFQVAQSYADLLAAEATIQVYEEAVAQRQTHLNEADLKSKAGLKPEIDVYTARAELARAQLELVNARNRRTIAKVALDNAMALGADAPEYRLVDKLRYEDEIGPLESFLSEAFAQRPDLKVLEDQAVAAGARIEQVKSDYLPTFGLTASYSARGQDLPAANNADVGLVISWPIFNGFLTDHELAEDRLHAQSIEQAIDDIRQRIYAQVKGGFLGVNAAVQHIHQAEQSVEASRSELDLAQRRYQIGLGNILELTEAQRRATQDQADYVQALADFSIAHAALDRDAGTTPTLEPEPQSKTGGGTN